MVNCLDTTAVVHDEVVGCRDFYDQRATSVTHLLLPVAVAS